MAYRADSLRFLMRLAELVLGYAKSTKHVGPLWFSNVANNIMWFTYVKACWRAILGAFGLNKITFKTTLKVPLATAQNPLSVMLSYFPVPDLPQAAVYHPAVVVSKCCGLQASMDAALGPSAYLLIAHKCCVARCRVSPS